MFEFSVKNLDSGKTNQILKKNINLDINLDAFILISSSNQGFAENILNYTLEHLIDSISKEDTYQDFSLALESINSFIKTWRAELDNRDDTLDMIIGILNEDTYTFSNIGGSSACLLNKNGDVVELTERIESKTEFSYVSSGKLLNGEIVVSSTLQLLNYLSKNDLIDGFILADDIEIFNKNIINILEGEIVDENFLVSSLKINNGDNEKSSRNSMSVVKHYLMKAIDNRFSKKIIGSILFLSDKIRKQSKLVNNILLFVAILIGIFILYNILSFFVNTTSQTENKKEAENTLIQIETLIRTAGENINNSEIFEKNITDAEVLVKQIREQNLYSKNLTDIINELNLLKRQFNKIEIFNESESNLVRALDENIGIKIVRNDSEIYVLDSKSVVGPILVTQKPGIYTFSNLGENETFVDGIFIGQNLYILTNNSKIIRFAGKGVFEYANVSGQDMWENIKQLGVYTNTNLYTLGTNNQIYRHTANGTNFNAGDTYLKVDDITQIGNILSIAIDGGFYILKEDLSMIKMIRDKDPYRLESLVLSNLPENYKNYIFKEGDKIELKAGTKLNYVYMLLDNKIFVFKPNTKVYTDTKNLTYIGQIEGATKTIKDFYVSHDGEEGVAEILVLNESGIYKLNFQVSDNKIMIR